MFASFAQGALLVVATPAPAVVPPPPVVALAAPAPAAATPNPEAVPAVADTPFATPADPAASPAPQTPAAPAQAQTPTAPARHAPGDPLESFNRTMFRSFEKADKAVLRPAAMGYEHGIPKFVRDAFRNILLALTEPIVFLNDLLQFRPVHALRTLSRFVINATMGWGGTFDVAKRPYFNLPHEDNSFADTLGYYGIGPGPYLFLPLLGPTTLRDLIGGAADGIVLPFAVGKPFNRKEYQIPVGVIGGLDQRAEADDELKMLFDTAVDPYATLRSVYLQDRAGEIAALRGHHAPAAKDRLGQDLTDPLAKPEAKDAPQSQAPQLDDPLRDPVAGAPPSPNVR